MANTDLLAGNIPTTTPHVYDYTYTGTVAATTTISTYPCVLHSITISPRAASGAVTVYDSVGTSATVVASIVLGTQTFSDPPSTYILDVRTKTALTVANSGNTGVTVAAGK